jgi:Sulfatase
MFFRTLLVLICMGSTQLVARQVGLPAARPNILLITSEDNSAFWLGCYGNAQARTPNIDRLASEGVLFNHAYSNAPVCAVVTRFRRSTSRTSVTCASKVSTAPTTAKPISISRVMTRRFGTSVPERPTTKTTRLINHSSPFSILPIRMKAHCFLFRRSRRPDPARKTISGKCRRSGSAGRPCTPCNDSTTTRPSTESTPPTHCIAQALSSRPKIT